MSLCDDCAERVFVFYGKGRCASAVAYVLGETEAAARARLLRDDSCPFFLIDRVELFTVGAA